MQLFKRIIIIISILIVCFSCMPVKDNFKKDKITDVFPILFKSNEFETRITAIILSSEFKNTQITNELLNLLKEAKGIEKVAILYTLRTKNDSYIKEFINAIPEDAKGIKELLDIESPRSSYFMSPKLRIIDYLASLAIHNDNAFRKLITISNYADGWQGDAIMELLEDIKKWRDS